MRVVLFESEAPEQRLCGTHRFLQGLGDALSALGASVKRVRLVDDPASALAPPPSKEIEERLVLSEGELRREAARATGAHLVLVSPLPLGASLAVAESLQASRRHGLAFLCRLPGTELSRPLPSRAELKAYDAAILYGGGPRLARELCRRGARRIYLSTVGADSRLFGAPARPRPHPWDLLLAADCSPAALEQARRFVFPLAERSTLHCAVAGLGWRERQGPRLLRYLSVPGAEKLAAAYRGARVVFAPSLRDDTGAGSSAPPQLFEAAACGACIATDPWPGLEALLAVGDEVRVARGAADLEALLALGDEAARNMGGRARARVLAEHTCRHRARELLDLTWALRPLAPRRPSRGTPCHRPRGQPLSRRPPSPQAGERRLFARDESLVLR